MAVTGPRTTTSPCAAIAPDRAQRARRALVPIALAIVGAAFFFAPKLGVRWPCPIYTILHVPCPGCGLTRATRLAMHGDVAAATHMHPLWIVIVPFLVVIAIAEVTGYLRTGAWGGAARIRGVRIAGRGVVALMLIVWAVRFLGAFGGPCPGY